MIEAASTVEKVEVDESLFKAVTAPPANAAAILMVDKSLTFFFIFLIPYDLKSRLIKFSPIVKSS